MKAPLKILIIKLSAIGDVVHMLPVLESIHRCYPDASIDWVVERTAANLIEPHPLLRRVIVSDRKRWQKTLFSLTTFLKTAKEIISFVRTIRSEKYDIILDMQGLMKSGVITGLARGGRKLGLGESREGASFFLTEKPAPVNFNDHAIDRYMSIFKLLKSSPASYEGKIPVTEKDQNHILKMFADLNLGSRPIVGIHPMAKWHSKLWYPERFVIIADRLISEFNCDVIFTGDKEDQPYIDEIINKMTCQATNIAGLTSLRELAFLYTKINMLVTTDTGSMHIAAAMKCSVIALFGPTAPWRTGPYGEGHISLRSEIGCSPCYKRNCNKMHCMEDITTEKVINAVASKLSLKQTA